MTEALARNWGWVMLRGIVAIVFGVPTLAIALSLRLRSWGREHGVGATLYAA